MRTVVRLAAVLVLLTLCAKRAPPQVNDKGPGAGDAANNTCPVTRRVLGDGTIEIQNKDCTITRVPKKELAAPPLYDAAPEAGTKTAPDNVQKLLEMKPQPLPAGETDATMRAKYVAAMNAYFDYYTAGYQHRQRVFEWQLISSNIIFVLVALLVLSGVYFAAIQFHAGLRRQGGTAAKANASDEKGVAVDAEAVTTFSASAKGIEVSSPVLGVIILVISLAFFYLYLFYVYPVTELF